MQTQYISLCNNEGINIKSHAKKMEILNSLEHSYGVKIVEKHHERFYAEKHSNRLQKVPHVVSLKTNGNPYFMFLTTVNFSNVVIMIDKKIQMGYSVPRMIIIKLAFNDDELFTNTLFEGEMVLDRQKKWVYLISDLLVYKKSNIKKQCDFLKRLQTIYSVVENNLKPSFQNLFAIQVKKYVTLDKTNWLINSFSKNLTYSVRGIYIKPLYSKFKDLLVNNNDSLIVTNSKQKMNHDTHFRTTVLQNGSNGSRCHTDDPNKNKQKETQATSLRSTCVNENITPISDDPTPSAVDMKEFLIQKTETPDLYKIYCARSFECKGNACIDSLKTSKFMNTVFTNISMLTKLKFRCKKNANVHFKNVWIPVEHME
jgi:hypothetical protein